MKFACDSCHAQYLISDDKVGPNGVIVRCKKCQNKIVVRRPGAASASQEKAEVPLPGPEASAPAPQAPEGAAPSAQDEALGAPAADPQGGAPMAAAPAAGSAPVSEPGGIDDELGRAFDSVLAHPGGLGESAAPQNGSSGAHDFALAAAASAGGRDLESTTVVDLRPMASLIRPENEPEKVNGAADATAAEWFVAINDAQTGPLTMEGVRAHWDKGELSGDSLVWRAGLPDWKPLSTVPELAEALAPVPKPPAAAERAEAPAGAIATGVQAPVASALPPPQGAPAEPTWKPSAASALESLVKQELEALQKPPEKKPEPAPAAPEAPAEAKGLIDELPPAGDEPPRLERVAEPGLPWRAPAAHEEEGGGPAAPETSAPPRPRREGMEPQREARPAPAPRKRSGVLVGVIIGVVLAIAAGAGALVWVVGVPRTQPQPPVATAPAQPAGSAETASSPAAAAQPAAAASAAPAASAGTGQPEKVASAAAPAEAAAAKEAASTPPKAAAAAAPAVAAAPPAKQHTPKVAAASAPVAAAPAAKEPEGMVVEAPPPARTKPSPGSIDAEFEKMFGGPSAAAAEPPPKKDRPRSQTYIPPAPGGGAGKESLGQGDIMEVVLANKAAIKKCTESSGGSGTVAMRWTIRPDGGTTNVQTVTPEFQKTPLANCLTSVIRSFRFPAYSGPQMQPIDFPFKF